MRKTLGTVAATAAAKPPVRAATPELPRLAAPSAPVETISLKAATNRLVEAARAEQAELFGRVPSVAAKG
jgi:hypothetical protein